MVWPVLREQNVRTGHNVVVYRAGGGGMMTIDAGVEVFTDFTERGEVRHMSTPSGDMATTAHYGEYSEMARRTRHRTVVHGPWPPALPELGSLR